MWFPLSSRFSAFCLEFCHRLVAGDLNRHAIRWLIRRRRLESGTAHRIFLVRFKCHAVRRRQILWQQSVTPKAFRQDDD